MNPQNEYYLASEENVGICFKKQAFCVPPLSHVPTLYYKYSL